MTLVTNLNVFISKGEKDSDMDPSTLVWEPISFHSMRSHSVSVPFNFKDPVDCLQEKDPNHKKIPEVTHYVIQIYKKLGDDAKAKTKQDELLANAPDSKWAKFYK